MYDQDDPFRHQPGLRDRIADPDTSFWRGFSPADFDARIMATGAPANWRHSDAEIEATRAAFLAPVWGQDLWVFAYGSLMWDPGFRFAELRRGRLEGYARRFCLRDDLGGRGSPEAPGLMAALADGAGCDGLVFRVRGAEFDAETAILWRREMIAPAYRPVMVSVDTDFGPVRALTFAADASAPPIRLDLCRAEQVQLLATGRGMLGSSLHYIEMLVSQLDALGIVDADVVRLLAEAQAKAAKGP